VSAVTLDLGAQRTNLRGQASTAPSNPQRSRVPFSPPTSLIPSSYPYLSSYRCSITHSVTLSPSLIIYILRHLPNRVIMTGKSEGQSIRLEGGLVHIPLFYLFRSLHTLSAVISGKNLRLPSGRIPAGIYVSVNANSKRRWKSAVRVLSSDDSVVWNESVTL
jgi:hypothetical protein